MFYAFKFHLQVKGLGMSNKRFTSKDSANAQRAALSAAGQATSGKTQVTCDMGAGDPITFHQFHQLHWRTIVRGELSFAAGEQVRQSQKFHSTKRTSSRRANDSSRRTIVHLIQNMLFGEL